MPKKGPKFIEFDYQGIHNNIKLQDALTPDGKSLLPQYDRHQLYCPSCHIARLTFVSQSKDMHGRVRKAHLVTKRPSKNDPNNHADGCDGTVSHAPVEVNIEHYVELTNEQITERLAAEVRRYLRELEGTPGIDVPMDGDEPPAAPRGGGNNVVHRTLPRRSIYKLYNVEEELYGIPVLLYGDVKLHLDENTSKYVNGSPYYYLNVLNKDTGKQIRAFYRASNRDDIDENAIYHLVIIVRFGKNDLGKMTCELYTQQAIDYRIAGV